MNDLVKFKTDSEGNLLSDGETSHEFLSEDEMNKWHLINVVTNSGAYTICGQAISEYDNKTKSKEKGGITCGACLGLIRWTKSVKL